MLINETLSVRFGADSSRDVLRGLAQMFYMVSPQETTFEEPEEVPKYFRQGVLEFNDNFISSVKSFSSKVAMLMIDIQQLLI
uniref:Uncharacterized protein n=1 Tax=Timema genevievae TaxID=629358 RepID=A0A7R9PHK6_TIMGE|nr:unnamed protein product [Timema genevievae]